MKLRWRLTIAFGVASLVLGAIAAPTILNSAPLCPLEEDPAVLKALAQVGIDLNTLDHQNRDGVLICIRERIKPSRFGGTPAILAGTNVTSTTIQQIAEVVERAENNRLEQRKAEERGFVYVCIGISFLLAAALAGTGWYRGLHPRWSLPVIATGALVLGVVSLLTIDQTPGALFVVMGFVMIAGWLVWMFRHRIR